MNEKQKPTDKNKEPEEAASKPENAEERPQSPDEEKNSADWEKKFTGGRDLRGIEIEIESAQPAAPGGKSASTAGGGSQNESGESGRPSPDAPATPTNRKTPSRPQPAVYELDLDLADDVRDAAGRIDWSRAMSRRSLQAAPPASEAPQRPASPSGEESGGSAPSAPAESAAPNSESAEKKPARPSTTPEFVDDWARLPGAEKVLRMPPPGRRPRKPPSPEATEVVERPSPAFEPPSSRSSKPAPSSPSSASASPAEEPMSRYEQLKRQPSFQMDPEAVKMANEFSQIMFHVSRALHHLKEFRRDYPYLIAPNIYSVWEDNLKESSTTMLREFQHMKDPRQKQYDRKYVCKICKSVFFVSLPDGICDECRGKMGPKAPY